jgi:hypothetical protein
MNQDQQVDNDLQKAIDDITNNTNADPVFADPVAAPSSIPEGDTGEMAEPVGPFPAPEPAPEPKVEVVQPTEQMAPIDPITVPDIMPPEEPAPMPPVSEPVLPPAPAPEPPMVEMPAPAYEEPAPADLTIHQVKEAALRDLVPLLGHLDMDPIQKFNMYRNIFEDLRDYTVLESAYRAAAEIQDEGERAQALLYLVEAIDRM